LKVKKHEGSDERAILTAMIVDPVVAAKVAAKWNREGLFASRWANLVGGWAVKFVLKYGKPAGRSIENVFRSWSAANDRDKEQVALVDRFLAGLSDEWERAAEINSEHVVDLAGRHFRQVALARLSEEIQGDLDMGDPDRAAERVAGFGRIELGMGSPIDVLRDDAAIQAVFEEAGDPPLIEWPGAAGEFFGRAMERDSFVAFLGPEKRGKTFWLIETAWRAMQQRKRVLFLEVGDMSERQIMRRFMVRAARRPFRSGTVLKPTAISRNDDGALAVEREELNFDRDMSKHDAQRACEKLTRGRTEPNLRLSVHSVGSMSVDGIRMMLKDMEQDGWTPDVVCLDYADLLDMGDAKEKRHAIDKAWGGLRGLSQDFHLAMVTATQADSASYAKAVLTMENFSESKLKNAHTTGIVGLNQTREEREQGAIRLNWVVLRENESGFTEYKCVGVAECRPLARVCTVSCW
jgi:hypothetical protein